MVNRKLILASAIDKYGVQAQVMMAIEEMAELTKALCKLPRSTGGDDTKARIGHVREELADVQIMIDQMKLIYGDTEEIEQEKLDRLEKMIRDPERESAGK